MSFSNFIARPGQLLVDHLLGVGAKAKCFANKIGLENQGELIGVLHDIGKYSQDFQRYIQAIANKDNPNFDEDYGGAKTLKGKIDHSTAGAQWIWAAFRGQGKAATLCGQILALCIASHHSGLIDCLRTDTFDESKINGFDARMNKVDELTHLQECLNNVDEILQKKIQEIDWQTLIADMTKKLRQITASHQNGQQVHDQVKAFYLGFLTRLLFSCLIDADRLDSAGRTAVADPVNWALPIERLDRKLIDWKTDRPIDLIRCKISDDCVKKAGEKQGIYSLTVPTGGGKTYASLRYALHHAQKHKLDRIIYVIPYTSIIEQNAEAIRSVIEEDSDSYSWVLEHHSNLDPEEGDWRGKLASENWESPIILTTMVQFLEVLFSGGTKSVRRMHQLANSVLIFDEIQTLPIRCTHIFCNALNFLVEHARTTAVLCTATQPLLNELKTPEKGQLFIPEGNELVADVNRLFEDLERVDVLNQCKLGGWNPAEILDLVLREFEKKGSCLVIVNTKAWAQDLYRQCKDKIPAEALFHLSTNQYPEHRKKILWEIKSRLTKRLPVVCISTQLIEAGVDISFASVVRFLAGLDSIAQAAGRCNRNGELKDKHGNTVKGVVYVINPDKENVSGLSEIVVGQEKARRVFEEFKTGELLSPEKIKRYFQYYFFDRAEEMDYRVSSKECGYDTTLLGLLSDNNRNIGNVQAHLLRQSFMTAGDAFKAIDAPTQAVIIQHGEGVNIINELCRRDKKYDAKNYYEWLRKAQRYSVNIFPNVWKTLQNKKAVYEIQNEGIFFLDERYYSEEFGLTTEEMRVMSSGVL